MTRARHLMDPAAARRIDFSGANAHSKGPWLSESLTAMILSMAPGDRFPSDRVLAERYKVARMTVSREVSALAAKGLLERIPGKGTYVRRPSRVFETLTSFTDMATWYQASARILSIRSMQPTRQQRESLGLSGSERVTRIHRVRMSAGEPLAVERTYLAEGRFGSITRADLEGRSMYAALEDRFGSIASSADQTITLDRLSRSDAKLLDLEPDTTVMRIDRTTRDNFGLVIDVSIALCHPDRFRVHVQFGLT